MQYDRLREADIAAVLEMAAALSAHEGMPPPDLTHDKLYEVLFGPDAFLHGRVARVDQRAIGYILWTIGYDMQDGTRTVHIIDLFVTETHRMQGVARSLMREATSYALKLGYLSVTVQTYRNNQEANAFYQACGAKLDKTNVYYLTPSAMEAEPFTPQG